MAFIIPAITTLMMNAMAAATTAGGFMAANAGTIGTALSVGSTIYGGIRAKQGADAEAKSMVKKGNEEYVAGQREAMKSRKERDLLLSRQRAVAAASGGDVQDPSVQAVMGRTQQAGDYNAMMDMYNGAVNRADLYQEAKTTGKEGVGKMWGAVIDAGSTIYGDIAKRRRANLAYQY